MDDLWQPGQPLPHARVLGQIAQRCGDAWDMPDLGQSVRVGYNPRLRTTLGQAHLQLGQVELNGRLLSEHPDELIPTLVHELAHVAVYRRYGRRPPHGLEFRTLMRAVNLTDRATHSLPVARQRRRRYLYLHRCSVCGQSFLARRVRRDCHCARCGPEMDWQVLRAPDTQAGRDLLTLAATNANGHRRRPPPQPRRARPP